MNSLVIGANSFLGKKLCETLYFENCNVTGVYHTNKNNLAENIDMISMLEMFNSSKKYDVVYIISAYIPRKGDQNIKKKLQRVNVDLVNKICNQFSNSKIVYCSTVSLYKEKKNSIYESSKVLPDSLYGKSKLEGEKIVLNQAKYSIVRISSMYGREMNETTFLPAIIKDAIKIKKINLLGNGSRLQNYISVTSVASYLIESSKKDNNIYLATNHKSYSNLGIAKIIQSEFQDVKIIFSGIDNSKSYIYDNSFSRSELKINNNVNFIDSLKDLIKWQLKKL